MTHNTSEQIKMNSNINLNVLQIKQAIEAFPHSDARTDCLSALSHSKEALVKHLDQHLWVPAEYAFDNDEDKKYYQDCGAIEEKLVGKSLIYND
jgi:hypothetical protein